MADLDTLESRRLQLEENIAKLRKALQHWQTWDAEYEGVKEDLLSLKEEATIAEIEFLSKDFGGELVNEREIRDILGLDKGHVRAPLEAVQLIKRRQEYVQQSIRTISNQLFNAEIVLSDFLNEEDDSTSGTQALPLSEIEEELDDDDNIISSRVTRPEAATASIVETLRKAGLTDFETGKTKTSDGNTASLGNDVKRSDEVVQNEPPSTLEQTVSAAQVAKLAQSSCVPESLASEEKPRSTSTNANCERNSVSFADEAQDTVAQASPSVGEVKKGTSQPKSPLVQGSFDSNARVIELDEDDEIINSTPVIPEDESPEDARLRREMLRYSLNEIGSVIAEIDLDETYSDDDDETDLDLDDDLPSLHSDLSEDEDEFGRDTNRVLTEDYRKQMLDLEEKLGSRLMANLGPVGQDIEENTEDMEGTEAAEVNPNDLKRLVVRDVTEKSDKGVDEGVKKSKKSVRFAEELSGPSVKANSEKGRSILSGSSLSSTSNVRVPAEQTTVLEKPTTTKQSRFKQSRSTETRGLPVPAAITEPAKAAAGPESGRSEGILMDNIIERKPNQGGANAPEVDEFDPDLQRRQLASEYYKSRNNMIRQQGGFKPTEEELDQPLMEDRDGKVKKVSRFKAARLQ